MSRKSPARQKLFVLFFVAPAFLILLANWWMLRISHPPLSAVRPVKFAAPQLLQLGAISLWTNLGSLAYLINVTCDRIVINGAFGPGEVPGFRFNNRLCELLITFVSSASFFALPGLVLAIVVIRGIARRDTDKLGNFWVDTTRCLLWVLLPICLAGSLVFVSQGVVQNFWALTSVLAPFNPAETWKEKRCVLESPIPPCLPLSQPMPVAARSTACTIPSRRLVAWFL